VVALTPPAPKEMRAMTKKKDVLWPMMQPRAQKVMHVTSPPPIIIVKEPPTAGPSGLAKAPLFSEGAESGGDVAAPSGVFLVTNTVI